MHEFSHSEQDFPPMQRATDAVPSHLPEVHIGQESDDEPPAEPDPFLDDIPTDAIGVAEDLTGDEEADTDEGDEGEFYANHPGYVEHAELTKLSLELGGGWYELDGLIEFPDVPEGDEIDRLDTPASFEPPAAVS